MLLSDAHGGFGGIAQYNRDVIEAMSGMPDVARVTVVPRIIPEAMGELPPRTRYIVEARHSNLAFLWHSLKAGLTGERPDMVLCAHANLMAVAWLVARLCRVPLVLLVFGIDVWQPPRSALAAWASRRADHVISISKVTLDRMRSWADVPEARASLLPNAIHLQDYSDGPKPEDLTAHYDLAGRTVLMTFGRLHSEERAKGFDEILDILPDLAERLPDIAYVIAGTGDDRERLEEKAASLGVAHRVRFTGRVPEERKSDYYKLADLYVMPSRGEGFGFVIIEALACGVPVVASSIDGGREAVLDGELGPLVDPDDRDALISTVMAGLRAPHGVPDRLSHFAFPAFRERLRDILNRVTSR